MTTATSSEQTAQTVTEMYQSAIDGDIEKFMSFISDECEVHEPPFLPYGKIYHGKDGFQELFGEAVKHIDLATLKIESVIAQDDRAWAVVTAAMNGSGEVATIAEQWILRDSQIVWGRVFWFNPEMLPEV